METSTYALIPNGENIVVNTIICDEDFEIEGFYKVKVEDGVFCEIGMNYDKKKGFY
ncbi:MAG: hypothetical protein E6Z53_12035 [Pantoea sp.]|nr:hypothetical protein [Pantoea sp.]